MLPYTLGLDIGIASVGWCLLGERRIIDLGVRAFDKAETADKGLPLNLARRTARLTRHRLAQRAWRLKKLTRELKRHGLIDSPHFFQPENPATISPWLLRVQGLDRQLNRDEWARVIYHLCKHRGFHWVSRAEEKEAEGDAKSEGGKVKQGLAGTRRLMEEKRYRSAAEMIVGEFVKLSESDQGRPRQDKKGQPIPCGAARNKQGEYTKALSRVLLGDELRQLFALQRGYGNPFASAALETTILGSGDHKSGLFWQQKPMQSVLSMLGKCTFEKDEYRAPKASFTAERHVWLTRLNNLRIVIDGVTRPLNEQERLLALPLPYQQASDTYKKDGFTYKQLAAALIKSGLLPKEDFRFAALSYPSEKQKTEGKAKDPESATLVKLPGWQELRSTLKKAGLETEWEGLAGAAFTGQPSLLDEIARVLSIYKDDDEARAELNKLDLPNRQPMVEALLDIRFDKFHALSLAALYKIVPFMETGMRYDEAVTAIPEYGHHSQLHKAGEGQHRTLPPLYAGREADGRMVFADDADIPRNPVVLRALNQARKVVNAIIRRYGSPLAVNIEMARDLSRPLDERNKIKKEQDDYKARNERDKAQFVEQFGQPPKGGEFEKFRLYREQLGKCAYSLEAIDLERLLEPGYVEIDHALPYSRSFDDSKNNKVLVLTKENRDKGNRTPYEYLSGAENSPRWQLFVAYVQQNHAYRLAKRSRLLRKDFGEKEAEEFKARNLSDTRYICRFFKNYVERHLKLAEGSEAKRCVVLSGQMTAFLRARWGINKIRSESDRHHALDAAVVAACTHGMVKRLADYSRTKELAQVSSGFVDTTTGEIVDPAMFRQLKQHFPEPWLHFHHELEARLKIDNPELLREEMARLGSYDEVALEALRPLFVSRAVQRRNGGAAHKDTIYGQPEKMRENGGVTQKVALASVTLKDLDNLVDPHRNAKLYAAIRERLEAHGGKGDKAFPASNPLHKPDRDGNPTGPVVRTVTLLIDKLSGIPVRGGIARNDSMLRVDVFSKGGKFYLVPVYVHHRVTGLPNRAIIAHKLENEWTVIDASFDFITSLHANELVQVTLKEGRYLGYFAGCDRSDGKIALWAHDRNVSIGSNGLLRVASKTAHDIKKFHVDTLGNIHPAKPEPRRGLA